MARFKFNNKAALQTNTTWCSSFWGLEIIRKKKKIQIGTDQDKKEPTCLFQGSEAQNGHEHFQFR